MNRILLLVGICLCVWPEIAAAQSTASTEGGLAEVVADTTGTPDHAGPSPGGAFLRSVLIPGWGQASVGAYHRAGFYFTVEAGSAWMLLKTRRTLDSATKILGRVEADVTAQLVADGITDPQEIANVLDENEDVADARGLTEVRAQQREDWIAFGLFMLLISGADAFVASHLADFPDPLETGFRVTPDGAIEVGVSLKLPFHD
jgi:Family of unknown function (DUF5683)